MEKIRQNFAIIMPPTITRFEKKKKTLKRLQGTVERKGKLLNRVLWEPFNSHCIAHIIKVPGFKINRCTI